MTPPRRAGEGRKPSKYGNRKVSLDGYTFDSQAEGRRYLVLRHREDVGEIMNLQVHKRWPLDVNGRRICVYEDDFNYTPILSGALPGPVTLGEVIVEDVKGVRTPTYRLKAKLMLALYGIRIQEITA